MLGKMIAVSSSVYPRCRSAVVSMARSRSSRPAEAITTRSRSAGLVWKQRCPSCCSFSGSTSDTKWNEYYSMKRSSNSTLRSRTQDQQQVSLSSKHDPTTSRRLPPNIPSETPRRIIFGSCSDSNEDLTYWDTFCDMKPDLVVLMGDNVYAKSSSIQDQYHKLLTHPSYIRATTDDGICILATVDDNDLENTSDDDDEEEDRDDGDRIARLQESYRLFKETFQPQLANDNDDRDKNNIGSLYQVYEWKDDIQIILLDLRTHAINHSMLFDDETPTKTNLIDDKQWEWLEECLHRSINYKLRLIVSPIQVLPTSHKFECWYTNSPSERQRLLQLLSKYSRACTSSSGIDTNDTTTTTVQTMILSGDRHTSAYYRCDTSNDGEDDHDDGNKIYEITSSSLTHTIPVGLLDGREIDEFRISEFCYENNFGMIDIINDADNNEQSSSMVEVTIRSTRTGNNIDLQLQQRQDDDENSMDGDDDKNESKFQDTLRVRFTT